MKQDTEEIDIQNNESAHRFEALVDGHVAFVRYRYSDTGRIVFTHAEVPSALGGRGIGRKLARFALDYARDHALRVVSTCPFISSYVEKHPEYQSLVD